jgi:hypothetical protein
VRHGAFSPVKTKATKIAVFIAVWVVGIAVIAIAGLYWRLSQGPISLAFLGDSIEEAVNAQLPDLKISLGETQVELDPLTLTPHVLTRNIVLNDADGQVLASAPRAGVALSAGRLLRGVVSVTELELINPRVSARRSLDGSVALGIQAEAASPDQEVVLEVGEAEAFEDEPQPTTEAEGQSQVQQLALSGRRLLTILDSGGQDGALSLLEEIKISRGSLRFYDEANDATWFAPQADLAFRRTEGGFVVAAKASVASGGEPWSVEASATYRRNANNYTANVAIANLVPANVADKIYALSQFARVNLPFTGNIEVDATEGGIITRATGQLFAGKGSISLPDYLAKPIDVEEASFRIGYEGADSSIEIAESSILMAGSRADVKGSFTPHYESDGRLVSISFDLKSENASVDPNAKDPTFVDKVNFVGLASVDQQRVDIGDLVVMSGNAGVRLRGVITAGEQSPGIAIAGRMREVSAELLKKLWPPVLAPRARGWINDNIEAGRITGGTFKVDFPPNVLALAQAEKRLPPGAVDLQFDMENVRSKYFKSLPVLRDATGRAQLKDNDFELVITGGHATLPSGEEAILVNGQFNANGIMSLAVPGKFAFNVKGSIPALVEYASSPDLKMMGADSKALPAITGSAEAFIGLELPLIKNVPRTSVKVTTDVKLIDAALAGVIPGIDLSSGQFKLAISPEDVAVAGPAKLNGVSSKVSWVKPRTGGASKVEIETVLDAKLRNKLGIKLDGFMSGDVPVKAVIAGEGAAREIKVTADLSDVSMKVSAASWSRPATNGTRASFKIVDDGKGGKTVEDLEVVGKGLQATGRIVLKPKGGFGLIDLDQVAVGEENLFAMRMEPAEDGMSITLSGKRFDVRPYIKNMVSPTRTSDEAPGEAGGQRYVIRADLESVLAHRGEEIKNVQATLLSRGGQIASATIEGKFVSGLPINIRLTPVEGGREFRVASADGGAALRASNFYSKVAGGELEFNAYMGNGPGSSIRKGELKLRRFDVRNEAALAELDSRGRPKKSGPRQEAMTFKRLSLPFVADAKFIRMCDIELKGNDLGAVAGGLIRKSDGVIDITGTLIPMQGLTGFLDDVPLFGPLLTGGDNEGIFGVTFAMGGTITNPTTQANPASAFLPGFLRKMAEFRSACGRGKTVSPPKDRK